MWRYHPQTEALVQAAREIAPLRVVRAAFGFTLGDDPGNPWLQRELEGGSLMDVGCYCVSALRLLGGEPETVGAVSVGDEVDLRMAGVMQLPGGVLGAFDCGFDVAPRGVIEVVGAGGTLVADDPWHGQAPRLTRDGEEIPVEAANPYGLELEDFSAAIREGRRPRLGREDAVGQARAIEMLYAAAG
jgi:predicted dehydrogenase